MVPSHDKFTSIPFPVVWSTIYFGILKPITVYNVGYNRLFKSFLYASAFSIYVAILRILVVSFRREIKVFIGSEIV